MQRLSVERVLARATPNGLLLAQDGELLRRLRSLHLFFSSAALEKLGETLPDLFAVLHHVRRSMIERLWKRVVIRETGARATRSISVMNSIVCGES